MIEPTTFTVSGDRLRATYEFHGPVADVETRANALRVEQTIEFPVDLVPDDDIKREIVGRIEGIEVVRADLARAVISYAVETTGYELPQLINVLWGNSSILPGIRLIDFELPGSLLARFPGPTFGVAGLRKLFEAPTRPLLATALKPMGLSADRLAANARDLVIGGIDIIKDDHSLANQQFAPFLERIKRCANAVNEANAATGNRAVYMPSVNAPYDQLDARVEAAIAAGAGGLLVLPGITGFDQMRHVAATVDVPIMAHPAFLGSFSSSPTAGIAHGKIYGTLMRLAGADLSIYPNYGGRFSFTREQCREVAGELGAPLAGLAPAFPAPGGGMTLDRVAEIIEFYGNDVALLIGGDLHRGENLTETAARFRAALGD